MSGPHTNRKVILHLIIIMDNKNALMPNAKQSDEITDAFLQYNKSILKYWEKTIGILRHELSVQGVRLGKRCQGSLFLSRIYNKDFFEKIDKKHPERVVEALYYISAHPLVSIKGKAHVISFIWEFKQIDDKPWEYRLEFTPAVVKHFLAEDLTVEYDASLSTTFNTKAAPILYKKGCMVINNMCGFFEITEEQIRLTFSIDTIEDLDHLKEKKIKEISKLPIIYSDDYERFDHLIKWIVQPGIDEINEAYTEGRCHFMLRPEKLSNKVWTGKRGKPRYEYSLRVYIETEEIFAEAEEIVSECSTEAVESEDPVETSATPSKSASCIQTEIPFEYENDLRIKLQTFREDIIDIFRNAKASYAKQYIAQISAMVKERYKSYPTLPSAILSWINFTRKEVFTQNKKPIDLLCQVQFRIERYCHVYYCGKHKSMKKKRHEGEDPTPQFPLSAISLEEEKKTIYSNNDFFEAIGTEHQLSEETIRKYLGDFYTDREKSRDNYCLTMKEVVERFSEWMFPNSSDPSTDKTGTASGVKNQTTLKPIEERWSGEDLKEYDDVDGEIAALRANHEWNRNVFERFVFLNYSKSTVDEYLHRWGLELKASGINRHKNLGDAKSHFIRWLIIQEEKNNKNKNSYGTNGNNGYRTREDIDAGTLRTLARMSAAAKQPKTDLPVV